MHKNAVLKSYMKYTLSWNIYFSLNEIYTYLV